MSDVLDDGCTVHGVPEKKVLVDVLVEGRLLIVPKPIEVGQDRGIVPEPKCAPPSSLARDRSLVVSEGGVTRARP